MSTHVDLINKAKVLITDNFGLHIAHEYEKFYEDKDDELIKVSLESLLAEALGTEPAKIQLKKYKIV